VIICGLSHVYRQITGARSERVWPKGPTNHSLKENKNQILKKFTNNLYLPIYELINKLGDQPHLFSKLTIFINLKPIKFLF